MIQPTYELLYDENHNQAAIRCLICQLISHNLNDVEQHYCGNCHIFHDDSLLIAAGVLINDENRRAVGRLADLMKKDRTLADSLRELGFFDRGLFDR